jgi:hypothetical protein
MSRRSRDDRKEPRRNPGGRGNPRQGAPAPPLPEAASVPVRHPAMLAAIVVTAACVLVSVSFILFDTDVWHHLLVGRVIWQTHAVPTKQIWSWPTWGAPEANSAWLFRALVWPLWATGGIAGLFAWRWAATLAAFGIVWATARRMGTRGFAPLVALLLCAFIQRLRSQVRPETLVAVLLALEIWILETRRRGGGDRTLWLVAVAWVWANTHISYYLGFVVLAAYLADAWIASRRDPARAPHADAAMAPVRRLALVGLAALAVSFVNPFGWRALWQPFDFLLHAQHELMYQTIKELEPVDWRRYIHTVLPLLVGGWTLLIAWRAWRRAFDRVEALLCVGFTALALSAQRFVGFYAVVAAPFLMRDLGEWVAARRWPAWSRSPWPRAAITIAVCVAASMLEWRRSDLAIGIGFQWDRYPVRACDFIAANGVRGRGFNNFEFGGYQAWRFWPDRTRLPFMTGTPEAATRIDRLLYAGVFARADAWRALDRLHRFDYVLLERAQVGDDRLLDVLDADSTWALVFADDAGTVYVRRDGPLRAVAERSPYRLVPAGRASLLALGARMVADPSLTPRVEAELRERVAASPWDAHDLTWLADLEMAHGRYEEARGRIEQALRVSPALARGHERLGLIHLAEGRPREALLEFQMERERDPRSPRNALDMGNAWRRLGDRRHATDEYRRELGLDPGDGEALDSLAALARPNDC